MAKVKIDYNIRLFEISVEKKEKTFILKADYCDKFWNINSINKELKNKTFGIEYYKINKKEVVNFEILKELINNSTINLKYIKIINPENIIEIIENPNVEMILKDPKKHIPDIKKSQSNFFEELNDFKNYKKFKTFFKKALKNDYKIIDDTEFPGRMLKFYNKNTVIQTIYIKDEEFKFIKSYVEEYKKIQLENIKESVEKVNEKLEIEHKKKLKLSFK